MTMLAENYEYVIGGDPDRDTIDLAVLDTATGATRATSRLQPTVPATCACWTGPTITHRGFGCGRWKEPGASPPDWPKH